MFVKKYRLPFSVRFDKKCLFSQSFLFTARIRQSGFLHNRVGVVVSKKIDKRATVRNRMRRLVYTVAAELAGKTKKGFDFLFIIKEESLGKTKKDFYSAVENMLKKEGLYV